MQKADIQLPPQDPIDLWDFALLIAKSICPSLREASEHTWISHKLEPVPGTEFHSRSELTEQERQELLRLLPKLPSHASLSNADGKIFMDVFMNHPERPVWTPVFVTEDEITANGFEILKIQEVHLRALKQEIEAGNIRAVDRHHRPETNVGQNIFIGRDDALRYLRQRHLRVAEDPRAGAKSPRPPKPVGASENRPEREMARPNHAKPTATNNFDERTPLALPDQSPSPVAAPNPPRAPSPKTQRIEPVDQSKHAVPPPLVILRRKQVEARTSLSRSAIYDRLDPNSPRHDPSFPKQVKLSSNASGWVEAEIDDWLRARLSTRKK